MKITIKDKTSLKQGLTPNEVMLALVIRSGEYEEDISNMKARGILTNKNGQYQVTPRWNAIIDSILKESDTKDLEELYPLASKMMEVYPHGKQPGKPYVYQCNKREVALKLQTFFELYGEYSDDEIIDATKRYVASFRGNYQYLKLLKYFVFKNEDEKDENGEIHKVKHSYLADFLEDGSTTESGTSDWNTQTL